MLDCTGSSQNGVKWLKRLSFIDVSEEKFLLSYDPAIRYRSFIFPLTEETRASLSFREGFENSSVIYSFFPLPPDDNRAFMVKWLEGHRSMFVRAFLNQIAF